MTTFKTAESPFHADNTASNKCGFTLMNNQVGVVVAQVWSTESNVTVTYLPSMIRVDAIGRMDVVYDDTRLRAVLSPADLSVRPVAEYLPDLLGLIRQRAALREACLP